MQSLAIQSSHLIPMECMSGTGRKPDVIIAALIRRLILGRLCGEQVKKRHDHHSNTILLIAYLSEPLARL